jgi:hypothetical protein
MEASPRRHEGLASIAESSIEDISRIIVGVDDHAAALEACLSADELLNTSLMTITRGLLEGVLQVCELLDPHISPALQVARGAAFRLDTIEGSERTLREFPDMVTEGRTRQSDAVDGIHKWMADTGLILGKRRPGDRFSSYVELDGVRANLKFNVTDAAKRYLTGLSFAYPMLSGAAHSRGWYLSTAYPFAGEEGDFTSPEQTYSSVVLIALGASDALINATYAHAGVDPLPILKKTHTRRKALIAQLHNEGFHPTSYEDYSRDP